MLGHKSKSVDSIIPVTQKPNLPRGPLDDPGGATVGDFWRLSYNPICGDLRHLIAAEVGKQKTIIGTTRDLLRRAGDCIECELASRGDFANLLTETLGEPDVAVRPIGNRKR